MKAAILLAAMATPALADPQCFDRATLTAMLDAQANERQAVTSQVTGGGIVEVYVAPDGTWTMIAAKQYDGPLCIVASGTKWQMVEVGS